MPQISYLGPAAWIPKERFVQHVYVYPDLEKCIKNEARVDPLGPP